MYVQLLQQQEFVALAVEQRALVLEAVYVWRKWEPSKWPVGATTAFASMSAEFHQWLNLTLNGSKSHIGWLDEHTTSLVSSYSFRAIQSSSFLAKGLQACVTPVSWTQDDLAGLISTGLAPVCVVTSDFSNVRPPPRPCRLLEVSLCDESITSTIRL